MNARELLDLFVKGKAFVSFDLDSGLFIDNPIEQGLEADKLAAEALSLYAAAQSNDGSTPETDKVCITPIMGDAVTPHKWDEVRKLARRLEQQRTNLAAEVLRLREDGERYRWLRDRHPILLITGFFGNGCVNKTISDLELLIDAARGKK